MNAKTLQLDLDSYAESLSAVPVARWRVADTDWFPAVDVYDAGNEYLFEFDLPGLKQEQIQISMDRDALLLVGTRMAPQPGGMSLRVERPVGAFVRRLVLPADACGGEIHALLQDGVLELHVPRKLPPDENGKSIIIPFEEPHYEHTPS